VNLLPLFGYPNLCGQALIDWALANPLLSIPIFQPELSVHQHDFKVAGLEPYQIWVVCSALKNKFQKISSFDQMAAGRPQPLAARTASSHLVEALGNTIRILLSNRSNFGVAGA
jgi:hypothetical protein